MRAQGDFWRERSLGTPEPLFRSHWSRPFLPCTFPLVEQPLRQRLYDALDLYNRGDYLACQEILEPLHAESDPGDREMIRAMVMLATAMHLHFKRGGGRGVLNLIRQCLLILDDHRPADLGVRVDELYEALEAYLQELQDRRKPGAGFFDRWLVPRVRYASE